MEIHGGKTMLTFLDSAKDYKLYDDQNRVIDTERGDELYKHYDKVDAAVRERYEKSQSKQAVKTPNGTKVVTTTTTKRSR